MSETVLEVRELKTYFYTYAGVVKALDGVNLTVKQGETVGLVGETGCGKSVTSLSIMRLVPDPPGKDRQWRGVIQRRRSAEDV